MKIKRIMLAVVVIGLGTTVGVNADVEDRPFCGSIEAGCTHRFATLHGTAVNEFEKFKWDFMRRLDNLGSEASDEEKQHLVDLFCTKFEIRGYSYIYQIKRAERRCHRGLRDCECSSAECRGGRGIEGCRRGFKNNVVRRGWSYKTMIHSAVWECCREVEELAGLGGN